MKFERRTFKVELRAAAADGDQAKGRTISGYAALFNSLSEDLGGFREIIAPGAFDGCMDDDVRCLFNHDPNMVLGRTASKTLRIEQDDTGLKFECDLPDTDDARDLVELMKRGDVDQCSFAFTVARGGAMWDEQDNTLIRTVTKVKQLYDVSVVTYPAYTDTAAQVRSATEILSERATRLAGESNDGAATASIDVLRRGLDLALSSVD